MTCPSCWEGVTIVVDLSIPEQDYIEDCSVCCKPMRVCYTAQSGELGEISVASLDG